MTPFVVVGVLVFLVLVIIQLAKMQDQQPAGERHEYEEQEQYQSEYYPEPARGRLRPDQVLTPWMTERWQLAEELEKLCDLRVFGKWWYDEPSIAQESKLEHLGITLQQGRMTKGMASDLIGQFELIEDEVKEKLEWVTGKGGIPADMSQTEGRYKLLLLKQTDDGQERLKELAKERRLAEKARKERDPATAMQKEFIRFVGEKVPPKTSEADAEKLIRKLKKSVSEQMMEDWDMYQDGFNNFSEREDAMEWGLRRKVSLSLYRKAVKELRDEEHSMEELFDDPDLIADKIIEMKPEYELEDY